MPGRGFIFAAYDSTHLLPGQRFDISPPGLDAFRLCTTVLEIKVTSSTIVTYS